MRILAVMFFVITSLSLCPSFAQTPDECLAKVKALEPMLPRIIDSARASIHSLIPDPAAYEKTLPPLDKVIKDKDKVNFKNYGGLSEAYFYSGDTANGQRIFSVVLANSNDMLGADDTYTALVEGDLGILRFNEKNYDAAQLNLLSAIKQLEAHLTPASSNNLIADYLCMTLIRDSSDNKTDKGEASAYAKKLVDLTVKQRQPFPTDKTAAP